MFTDAFFNSSKMPDNPDTRAVMEFIARPESIGRMIAFSERGLPALTGIVEEMEKRFPDLKDFPLTHPTTRQNIGRMIKYVMGQFGYTPYEHGLDAGTRLRDFARSQLFSTSAVYKQTEEPKHKLELTIVAL